MICSIVWHNVIGPMHIGNTTQEMEAQFSVEKENFWENARPRPPLRHVPTLLLTAWQTPTRFAFFGQTNDCMKDVIWRCWELGSLCWYSSSCQSALVAFSKPINVAKNETRKYQEWKRSSFAWLRGSLRGYVSNVYFALLLSATGTLCIVSLSAVQTFCVLCFVFSILYWSGNQCKGYMCVLHIILHCEMWARLQ